MRNILVISNGSNIKQMVQSEATTRGELEAELNNLGIQTSGMSFFEGLTRTDLVDANSQLPQKAMYKGQWTTDLIITLTPDSIKKVANGISEYRMNLFHEVKERNLENEVKGRFGKNFTHCTTTELEDFLENYTYEDNHECDCEHYTTSCSDNHTDAFIDFLNKIKEEISNMINRLESPAKSFEERSVEDLLEEFGR